MMTTQELSMMLDSAPLSFPRTIRELKSISDAWKLDGVCRTVDPDLWFPEQSSSPREAKRMCEHCPVIAECLWESLVCNEKHGVWGGATRNQRIALRRKYGLTNRREPDELDEDEEFYGDIAI